MMVIGTMKKSSDDDSKRNGGVERIPQYADSGSVWKNRKWREIQIANLAQQQIYIVWAGDFFC